LLFQPAGLQTLSDTGKYTVISDIEVTTSVVTLPI